MARRLVAGGNRAVAAANESSNAEREGRRFVEQLLQQRPAENTLFTGVLKIRDTKGKRAVVPVKCQVIVTATSWQSVYEAWPQTNASQTLTLTVTHEDANPNQYQLAESTGGNQRAESPVALSGGQTMIPFAGSDFWVADLGMEFFHWPAQKILKKELRSSQSCTVLESASPKPEADGYVRVVSWIGTETGGIIHADAYDAKDRLLKQFEPKVVKKVNGQWQLQEMEIRNTQTGSRTRLEIQSRREIGRFQAGPQPFAWRLEQRARIEKSKRGDTSSLPPLCRRSRAYEKRQGNPLKLHRSSPSEKGEKRICCSPLVHRAGFGRQPFS